jgi:hypothetical protein
MDGIAAEGFPEAVELAGFRIVPAQATAGVVAFAETAEINPAIRAESRTMHDRDAGGTELADAPGVAGGAAFTGRRACRRAALA